MLFGNSLRPPPQPLQVCRVMSLELEMPCRQSRVPVCQSLPGRQFFPQTTPVRMHRTGIPSISWPPTRRR